MKNAKLEKALGLLKDGLENLFLSDAYRQYLQTMARFHQYSLNNCLLIAMQCPNATLVHGYNAWQKDFNRHVKKGERGIVIFAPMYMKDDEENDTKASEDPKKWVSFKAVSVFDISQTEGDPLPVIGIDSLIGEVDGYQRLEKAILAISPVPICFDDIAGDAKGYYSSNKEQIVIQKDMSQVQTIKTLIHEISHAKLHDVNHMKQENEFIGRHTAEIQAESIAYVVCSHFELDTAEYSFPYIAGWSPEAGTAELIHSLDVIRNTANLIIEDIEKELSFEVKSEGNHNCAINGLKCIRHTGKDDSSYSDRISE